MTLYSLRHIYFQSWVAGDWKPRHSKKKKKKLVTPQLKKKKEEEEEEEIFLLSFELLFLNELQHVTAV